ncbi:MAG: Hpt domain-containing protein, partial [Proteobacteria bacterium]|nr:Hpt domain-containing protein [Pseudomonadota bacterium]
MASEKILITPDPDLAEEAAWYREQLEKHLTNGRTALDNKDTSTLETIGHRIKGSAESFGFDGAGDIGKALETAAKANDYHGMEKTLSSLAVYLNRIVI